MVREYHHYTYSDNYSVVDLTGSPDLEKLAGAYGLPFIRLTDMNGAETAINRFLKEDTSMLMECIIDPMDLVK